MTSPPGMEFVGCVPLFLHIDPDMFGSHVIVDHVPHFKGSIAVLLNSVIVWKRNVRQHVFSMMAAFRLPSLHVFAELRFILSCQSAAKRGSYRP